MKPKPPRPDDVVTTMEEQRRLLLVPSAGLELPDFLPPLMVAMLD